MPAQTMRIIATPMGGMLAVATDTGLTRLTFLDAEPGPVAESALTPDTDARRHLDRAEGEIAAYFSGAATDFRTTLDPAGTPFQRRVWDALRQIPHGRTRSYGWLAREVGLGPGAARATGAANRVNPIAIFIPCHRVIGSDGGLRGYAGGVWRKEWLLRLEGVEARLFA